MNYPTVAQLLVEFSNQVKYKLDAVFHSMGFYETAGTVLARKFKEGAAEAVREKIRDIDIKAMLADAVKEAVPPIVEPLYVLPSGDAIKLSRLVSVVAPSSSVVVEVQSDRGYGIKQGTSLINISTDSKDNSVQVRDKILKDHLDYLLSLNQSSK
jgi:hypothetical protein